MNEADSPADKRPIFDASKFPLGDAKILPDYTQLKAPDDIDNMTSQFIQGSYSPVKDVVPNPFHYRIHLTRADKIKVALMSVFVVPIRIVLIIFFLFLTWIGCYLGQLGLSHKDRTEKPLTGFRRDYLKPFLAFFLRLMFESGGLTYSFKGQLASQKEAPVLVVGPHSSLLDGVIVLLLGGLTPVAKAGSEDVPIFGTGFVVRTVGRAAPAHEAPILVAAPHSSFFDTVAAMHGNPVPSAVVRSKSKGMFFLSTILNYTQPVYVKRSDPNSRQNTVREITRRATSKEPWSQVIIFPEGTCTNRSCLITFKQGAFVPGVPVQPILIRYPNELNTLIWTWDGPSAYETLWLTLCQVRTHMEIEYLPVYVPSEQEKKDPRLYAENVRYLMAKALRIPLSSYSYDDLKHIDVENTCLVKTVVCNRVHHLISRNQCTSDMSSQIDRWCYMCRNNAGIQFQDIGDVILKVKAAIKNSDTHHVSFTEFVALLGVPPDHISKNVFEAFDIDRKNLLDLRGLLAAFWLFHRSERHRTEKAFKEFCDDSKGICMVDFVQLIWILLALPKSAAMSLFYKIDTAALGWIHFEDFKEFISMTKWTDILASPSGNSDSPDRDKYVPSKEE